MSTAVKPPLLLPKTTLLHPALGSQSPPTYVNLDGPKGRIPTSLGTSKLFIGIYQPLICRGIEIKERRWLSYR